MSRFTLDAATDFLCGKCVDSLSANIPYHNAVLASPPSPESSHEDAAKEFAKAFRRAQEAVNFRTYVGWMWPLTELFEDKTSEPMRLVNAFIEPIIKEALERKQRMAVSEDDETLLDHLVKATDGEVFTVSRYVLLLINPPTCRPSCHQG
jgi:hypothetical protein